MSLANLTQLVAQMHDYFAAISAMLPEQLTAKDDSLQSTGQTLFSQAPEMMAAGQPGNGAAAEETMAGADFNSLLDAIAAARGLPPERHGGDSASFDIVAGAAVFDGAGRLDGLLHLFASHDLNWSPLLPGADIP